MVVQVCRFGITDNMKLLIEIGKADMRGRKVIKGRLAGEVKFFFTTVFKSCI